MGSWQSLLRTPSLETTSDLGMVAFGASYDWNDLGQKWRSKTHTLKRSRYKSLLRLLSKLKYPQSAQQFTKDFKRLKLFKHGKTQPRVMLSLRCEVNEQLYFRNGSQLNTSGHTPPRTRGQNIRCNRRGREHTTTLDWLRGITRASSSAFARVNQGRYSTLT